MSQWIRDEQRARIYKRDTPKGRRSPICVYCGRAVLLGRPPSDSDSGQRAATLDHVNPRLTGPRRNRPDNLVTCCFRCNGIKGDRTPEEWDDDSVPWNRNRPVPEWASKIPPPDETAAGRAMIATALPLCSTPACVEAVEDINDRRQDGAYQARRAARARGRT